jgi:Arc/MetJ-type ribon-helix-helix transcriptional regulator
MANQPGENTRSISFTLPRALLEAVEAKVRRKMTNKSEFIRQALMNYLTPEERAIVESQIEADAGVRYGTGTSADWALNEAGPGKAAQGAWEHYPEAIKVFKAETGLDPAILKAPPEEVRRAVEALPPNRPARKRSSVRARKPKPFSE